MSRDDRTGGGRIGAMKFKYLPATMKKNGKPCLFFFAYAGELLATLLAADHLAHLNETLLGILPRDLARFNGLTNPYFSTSVFLDADAGIASLRLLAADRLAHLNETLLSNRATNLARFNSLTNLYFGTSAFLDSDAGIASLRLLAADRLAHLNETLLSNRATDLARFNSLANLYFGTSVFLDPDAGTGFFLARSALLVGLGKADRKDGNCGRKPSRTHPTRHKSLGGLHKDLRF